MATTTNKERQMDKTRSFMLLYIVLTVIGFFTFALGHAFASAPDDTSDTMPDDTVTIVEETTTMPTIGEIPGPADVGTTTTPATTTPIVTSTVTVALTVVTEPRPGTNPVPRELPRTGRSIFWPIVIGTGLGCIGGALIGWLYANQKENRRG